MWAARIRRGGTTTAGGAFVVVDDGHSGDGGAVEGEGVDDDDDGEWCAIKIMDLEHVNINISGEFRVESPF